MAVFHKALADPTRLRILQRLAERPGTVTELIDSRGPLAAAGVVAPAPPQGGRARGDAPLRPRGHLHAQSRSIRSLPRAVSACSWGWRADGAMADGSLVSTEAARALRARVEPFAAGFGRVGLTPNALTVTAGS